MNATRLILVMVFAVGACRGVSMDTLEQREPVLQETYQVNYQALYRCLDREYHSGVPFNHRSIFPDLEMAELWASGIAGVERKYFYLLRLVRKDENTTLVTIREDEGYAVDSSEGVMAQVDSCAEMARTHAAQSSDRST